MDVSELTSVNTLTRYPILRQVLPTGGEGRAIAMLLASEPPAMEAYRVSRAVNTPRNNRKSLIDAEG
jgi:hypothetical protein